MAQGFPFLETHARGGGHLRQVMGLLEPGLQLFTAQLEGRECSVTPLVLQRETLVRVCLVVRVVQEGISDRLWNPNELVTVAHALGQERRVLARQLGQR